MIDRILELMKLKNLTPSQFADEIGIQRSGISHLISGRNKPSLEFVMKVLKRFPEVKADFLLYGITQIADDQSEMPMAEKEAISKKAPALFDPSESMDTKPEIKIPKPARKERPDKKIEKIVVFYDDKTFREYEPE